MIMLDQVTKFVDDNIVYELLGNHHQLQIKSYFAVSGATPPPRAHLANNHLGFRHVKALEVWKPGGGTFAKNRLGLPAIPVLHQSFSASRLSFFVTNNDKKLFAVQVNEF